MHGRSLNQCGLTGPGDHVNKNPMLGTLAAIPNAASTLALLPGSPAINAGYAARTTTSVAAGVRTTTVAYAPPRASYRPACSCPAQ